MRPAPKSKPINPAECLASPDANNVLQLYAQDFDSWEFTEAHPRTTPFCDTFSTLGGPDDT